MRGLLADRATRPGLDQQAAYFPDTNILITRFLDADGVGEVQDYMPIARSPLHPSHSLIRRIVCVRGSVEFATDIEPRFDYGRQPHELHWHERGAIFETSALTLALASPPSLTLTQTGPHAEFTLSHGESATFALVPVANGEEPPPFSEQAAGLAFKHAVEHWRGWLRQSRYTGRWREIVHRSALTLKLLTYRPTGAIVAAPTTSLPEVLGGERNWDYRYTWVRDAAFSLYALLRLGFTEEAAAFMDWLTDRVSDERSRQVGPLQVMYGIDGRRDLPEQQLHHLEGYRGSAPARVGNDAATQLQLDIYGELVDSIYLYNKHGTPISHDAWEHLSRIVEWVCEHWDQADEGIWETRGRRQCFTYSRLLCWVAVERALRIANSRGLPGDRVPLGPSPRPDLSADHGPWLERAPTRVRSALRHGDTRRLASADAAGQVPRSDRPALALHPGRDRRPARV